MDSVRTYFKQKIQPPNPNRRISPFSIVVMLAVVLFVGVIAWGIYQNQRGAVDGEAPDFTLAIYDSENIAFQDETMALAIFQVKRFASQILRVKMSS